MRAKKLKVTQLNVDESQEIAQRYRVMSMPTLIVFRDGQPAGQVIGAHKDKILALANQVRWVVGPPTASPSRQPALLFRRRRGASARLWPLSQWPLASTVCLRPSPGTANQRRSERVAGQLRVEVHAAGSRAVLTVAPSTLCEGSRGRSTTILPVPADWSEQRAAAQRQAPLAGAWAPPPRSARGRGPPREPSLQLHRPEVVGWHLDPALRERLAREAAVRAGVDVSQLEPRPAQSAAAATPTRTRPPAMAGTVRRASGTAGGL